MSYTASDEKTHPLLEVFADLGVKIGSLHKQMKDDFNWRRAARHASQPVLGKVTFSMVCNAAGFGIFNSNQMQLNGPDQGHIWYVRRIGVQGTIIGTTVTGRFDVFVMASSMPSFYTTLNQMPVGEWQDGSSSIPNNAFYGRGQMPLRFNENLIFVVSGAPNGQQISGQFVFEDFQEAAIGQDWSV